MKRIGIEISAASYDLLRFVTIRYSSLRFPVRFIRPGLSPVFSSFVYIEGGIWSDETDRNRNLGSMLRFRSVCYILVSISLRFMIYDLWIETIAIRCYFWIQWRLQLLRHIFNALCAQTKARGEQHWLRSSSVAKAWGSCIAPRRCVSGSRNGLHPCTGMLHCHICVQ